MANRYWVGGTASWDATAGTKWATTSGGGGGSAVPTAADDVFLDASSGANTVTISGSRVCRSFTCTGFTGTLTGASTPVLSIGDASGGAMTMGSGMTVALVAINFNFVSTSSNGGAGWPITMSGKSFYNTGFTFNGVGGKWTLQDTFLHTISALTLTNGTLDTNNQTITIDAYSSSNSNTRTMTLGTSTINITAILTGTVWNFATTTGLTFNGSSATINLITGNTVARTFVGGGLTYGTFNYTQAVSAGLLAITGSNTFTSFNVGSARAINFEAGSTTTVTNWSSVGTKNNFGRMFGGSSGTISAPDSAALSITGDITLLTRVALDSWLPNTNQMFMAKRAVTGNQRSYHWNLGLTGLMSFVVSTDGTAVIQSTVDVAIGFAAGSTNWVLVSRRASDGRVQFFKADGALTNPAASDFTQIGTDQTPSAGNIFDGTAPLEIGSSDLGTVQPASGSFYRAQIYNGLFSTSAYGGTLQFDADFSTKTFGADSFTESSANAATVTIAGVNTYGDGRIEIASTTSSAATLSKSSGVVSADYLKLTNSTAQGGATWYAGGNSINNGGNTGWIFSGYGTGNFFEMF